MEGIELVYPAWKAVVAETHRKAMVYSFAKTSHGGRYREDRARRVANHALGRAAA